MIDAVPLLSDDEARAIVATLDRLRPVWISRDDGAGAFATLGRAAYLDLCGAQSTVAEYRSHAAEQNVHLRENFGELLEAVRAKVEAELERRTVLTEDWALPGFHVFAGAGLRTSGTGGAHFDLQFRELIHGSVGDSSALSFTLALEVPASGTGLRVWPIRPAQLHASSRQSDGERLPDYLARKPSVDVRYQVGTMYLQRKPILHSIWNGRPIVSSDRRITLQGHGIEHRGEVVLYW